MAVGAKTYDGARLSRKSRARQIVGYVPRFSRNVQTMVDYGADKGPVGKIGQPTSVRQSV